MCLSPLIHNTSKAGSNTTHFKIMARSSRRSSRSRNRSRSSGNRASSSRRNRVFLFGAAALVSVLLVLVRGTPFLPPLPPSLPPSPPRRSASCPQCILCTTSPYSRFPLIVSQPIPPHWCFCDLPVSLTYKRGLAFPSHPGVVNATPALHASASFFRQPSLTIHPRPSSCLYILTLAFPPPLLSLLPLDARQRAPPFSRPHHRH